MKVFIVNGGGAYYNLFRSLGFILAATKEEADIACFTGGADVSPELYGDKKHATTFNSPARDQEEMELFSFFEEKGVPMVGICRGGQFLNVMSGGRMYQHVTMHTRSHEITDARTGRNVFVSSTHHQMFMPSPEAILVAFSTPGGTREWFDGEVARRDVSNTDYEVLYYPNTRCLCFQPHPEFTGHEYQDMHNYFKGLVEEFLIPAMI